ncbi:MAG: RNA polymerase-binding protein DksA [Rhodoferax sp.]|nr:RNA polymerase-binding protein DksA [Rhodoferax sp.]
MTKATSAKAVKAAPAKPGKPASAKPAKPVAKAVPSKVKAKETGRVLATASPSKAPSKAKAPAAPVKSKTVVAAPVLAKPARVEMAPPAPVRPVLVATPAPAAKAGRPSSRLAQLTVPSMAQSVASTAAKASYIQTMSDPLIAPPVASAAKKDPKLANNWKTKPLEQLTDADLMAMPDVEYMNATQMAVFRLKLSVLKQDILSMAGETTEHLREDTVVVPDPADRATIEEEHALELRTRDRERKLLKKIEQSISRIDAGDYGYCDETGEPIGVGRLLARPTATLSLEAQQRRELKQKMFGD